MKLIKSLALGLGILGATMGAAQAFNGVCDNLVFYAVTANQKKSVEICVVPNGVTYIFGLVGATHPEMFITVPKKATSFAWQSNPMLSINEFTVANGNVRYSVSVTESRDAPLQAFLDVYKGDKRLASIELDTKSMQNNIGSRLTDDGIPMSDEL